MVAINGDKVDCWSGTQKSHFVQTGLAAQLGVPLNNVHVRWINGPGSYGRNDADDCAADCAVLAKAVGKPVRLQYMRDQGTGWAPKGPASTHVARAALDAQGNVIAYEFKSKAFSRVDVDTNGSKLFDTLAGQTLGVDLKSGDGFGVPAESYEFANKKTSWETIPPLLDRSSPLRTSHLRDPVGPQIHFASESFMDEVASATNTDPIDFRLKYVKDPRDQALIKGAAEKFLKIVEWETGMTVASVRPANVYGPYQDPHGEAGVVAIFAQRMLRNEPVTIFGTGEDTRDYVYVDDVVEAFVRAAAAPTGEMCVIGTGVETSPRQIFEVLARHCGYERAPVMGPPRAGDIPRMALDSAQARAVWGWAPCCCCVFGARRKPAAPCTFSAAGSPGCSARPCSAACSGRTANTVRAGGRKA